MKKRDGRLVSWAALEEMRLMALQRMGEGESPAEVASSFGFLEPVHNLIQTVQTPRMREKNYPSDVSRERFEQIRPILEQARKRTKPVTVDMYEVWCAVLYLLRTGCPWRALPSDFPKWRTVHSYFAKWSEVDDEGISLLERALKKSGWRG
ncbi:transposase, partial [Xanthomonas oryzae]